MTYKMARLAQFYREGDYGRQRTIQRVDAEVECIVNIAAEGQKNIQLVTSTCALIGLGLGFLGLKRGIMSADQLRRLDAACRSTQLAITSVGNQDEVLDNWWLARAFVIPFVEILAVLSDYLNHEKLRQVIWIAERALIEATAHYFDADTHSRPSALQVLCTGLDRFVVDGDLNSSFKVIDSVHAELHPATYAT